MEGHKGLQCIATIPGRSVFCSNQHVAPMRSADFAGGKAEIETVGGNAAQVAVGSPSEPTAS